MTSGNDNQSNQRIGRSPSSLPSLESIVIEEGRGGRCWDETGRDYLDFICGYGPIVLGHADPGVTQAVAARLARGTLFPARSSDLDKLLQHINDLYPAIEHATLLKTGSEAIAAAIRLARAETGRSKILRIGFHGWHDQVVVPYLKWHQYDERSLSGIEIQGVPLTSFRDHMVVWNGNDFDELIALISAERSELAAVILDPVQLVSPFPENALRLQGAVQAIGAFFVLDESKTGFRVHLGGVQGAYGLKPDLTVLSKAIANGLPLALLGGRRDVMQRAADLKIKGTYSNELASVAAAIATISQLRDRDAPRALAATGERLIAGLNSVFQSRGLSKMVSAVPYFWPCMPYLHFARKPVDDINLRENFYQELVAGGVLMLPEHMNYVCLAHTDADLQETFNRVDQTLGRIVGRCIV